MMQHIALMSPCHLKIVDCQGTLDRTDIVKTFQHIGEKLKVCVHVALVAQSVSAFGC